MDGYTIEVVSCEEELLVESRSKRKNNFSNKEATEDAVVARLVAEKHVLELMEMVQSMTTVCARKLEARDAEVTKWKWVSG